MARRHHPLTAVLVVVAAGTAVALLRPDPTETEAVDLCADGLPCEESTVSFSSAAGGVTPPTRVRADDVCRRSGYLCAPLAQQDAYQLRRWKDFSGTIVVHVPRPDFEEPGTARDLQRAAAAGIRAWNGQPFPVVVDERGTREAHFAVHWTNSLGGTALGSAETTWHPDAGLRVVRLTLTTRLPYGNRVVPPRQLRLTAAHEMGHALGLPHSDEERDMMYPTNTATAPSAQDYRTLEALYDFEDGTEIVR